MCGRKVEGKLNVLMHRTATQTYSAVTRHDCNELVLSGADSDPLVRLILFFFLPLLLLAVVELPPDFFDTFAPWHVASMMSSS